MTPFAIILIALVVIWLVKRPQPEPMPMEPRSRALVFPNPVFNRELLTGLRSARLRWILMFYLLIPFVVIALAWPTNQVFYGGSALAVGVWRSYLVTQMWLVALLTPVFAAYSVSSEFQQDTAELLWITRLPARAIVAGKMAAVVLLGLALLVSSLASLSLVFYLGGVGVGEILGGFALLFSALLFTASIAIFYSARTRQGHLSLVLTYATMIGMPCLAWPIFGAAINPRLPFVSYGPMAILPLLVGGLFALAALRSADRPVGEKARANFKPIDDTKQLQSRRKTWPYYLVDPMRRWPPLPETGNLIAHQEPRMHPMQRSEWGYRCAAITGALTVVLLLVAMFDPYSDAGPGLSNFIWWMTFVVTVTWTVLTNAVSMTIDQEMGTMESIRLTLIRPREYLFGKWLGSLRMRWIMIVIGLVGVILVNIVARLDLKPILIAPLLWIVKVEVLGLLALGIASFCTRAVLGVALTVALSVFFIGFELWFREMWSRGGELFHVLRGWIPFETDLEWLTAWLVLGFIFWLTAEAGVHRKWNLER